MQKKTVQILSMLLFAGLLLWGGFALISYLGIPVHGLVLLNEAGQKQVGAACTNDGFLCRGFAALLPSVIYSVGRAAPFLGYVFVCALVWVIFAGWRALVTGEGTVRVSWRPVYFVPLFLGLVWLLFTVLSAGSQDGMAVRQIVEPTSQAYGSLSGNQLQALKDNFDQLQRKGCLAAAGQAGEGINVYWMRNSCVQSAFMTTVFPQFLLVCIFLFELLVLGQFLLRLLRLRPRSLLEEVALSAGIGAGGWIALLWLLAVAGFYFQIAGWMLAILIPLACFRETLAWIRRLLRPSPVECSWRSVQLLLGWLLLSYLAFNFLTVIRPFPIGWDDLGSYINRPRLLVSYGHFIFPLSSFQWEYMTSLGFLLFGYDSIFGATAAMVINWTEGLLAVLAVFLFARTFFGRGRGLLSALLYYTLPVVGHFSFADMKIDNAVFAMGALAVYCAFAALFPSLDEPESAEGYPEMPGTGWRKFLPGRWPWLLLGGVLGGFAFGMKPTAVMVILAVLSVLLGTAHPAAGVAGVLVTFFIVISQGTVNLSLVASRIIGGTAVLSQTIVAAGLGIGILLLFGWALYRRPLAVARSLAAAGIFVVGTAIVVAPWLFHNNVLVGNVVPHLVLSAPNTFTPIMNYRGSSIQGASGQDVRTLPSELKLNPDDPACSATGGSEELDRYWGFGKGWSHYLTLPWRTVMNFDAPGYYVTTMPGLLLFPLLLLLPFFWMKRGRWLRWLFLATSILIVEWMFLASGIPWYGIGMFLGLVIGLEAFIVHAPDVLNKTLAGVLIAFSLMICFAMRFWQFEQQRNLFEYPMGKISADTLRIRTIPYYDQIRASVMERNASIPERPYLYRVGTFIPYFIPRNLEVIGMTDHQLDAFNCLYQERNPELTLKRLKALGFNSIVFDTNTATIEQNPNGSLHKKVQEFVNFLNTPSLGLQIVVNDPPQGVAFILLP